jgi:hypothetical protein
MRIAASALLPELAADVYAVIFGTDWREIKPK